MRNSTRIKRLGMLRDMLKNHRKIFPEMKFDMSIYHCGTAACALGSAACYPPLMKDGLHLDWLWGPAFKGTSKMEAGATFFGLTFDETYFIFTFDKNIHERPKTVAKRVDSLLKHYRRKEYAKARNGAK